TNPGKSYHIEVSQPNGFPIYLGSATLVAGKEGCNPNLDGSFNTGFLPQVIPYNSALFIDTDCQPNLGSYDPNDKTGFPLGYGPNHYITDSTDLDYRIRFQNTGTDTAFLVVIRDTISPHLDLSTLQIGGASHSFTWQVVGPRVLEFTFANIMLVDSTTNEPESHGFVTYGIRQTPNNPIGTVINNSAAIYFDYNIPIITNTTFHEVAEDFIVTIIPTDENSVTDQGECFTSLVPTQPTIANVQAQNVTNDAPSNFPVGITKVTWTITDNLGNIYTSTQDVVVTDNEAPQAICQDLILQLDALTSTVSLTESQVDNGSSDACGLASLTLDQLDFTCDDLGTQTITLTVEDVHGNISTCTADITINDDDIDNTVSKTGTTLTANAQGGTITYQWLDCDNGNSPIAGETNAVFEADQNGSYAVEIDYGNGCTYISDCVDVLTVGTINAETIQVNYQIYPNPSTGIFQIEHSKNGNFQVEVYDALGRVVLSQTNPMTLDLTAVTNGVYKVTITDDKGTYQYKLQKQ
ncbi:MAG: T9SS type A sorting domain-containing protein, partial [Saprospiraceae bacterium]|nr:T9SS type A sorting domain-containing protein [Saprospiraceae bacterium]